MRKKYRITCGPHTLELGHQTRIMGIINITPDSFSHDGCYKSNKNFSSKAVILAKGKIREGADIIDVGGESTRPGAKKIPVKEEIERVIPTIRILAKSNKVPLSVDTYKSSVAQHALDAGAAMINNIKGIRAEKSLLKMVRNYKASIVLMHLRGTPRTMQRKISYSKLIDEIILSLRKSIENCLEIGIKSDKIIIDPGIGFGKTPEDNLEIINRLKKFSVLNKPLLLGTSRKSFIGKILDKEVHSRLIGTVATVCASILNGANIIRVHDVKEVKEAVTVTDAILNMKTK